MSNLATYLQVGDEVSLEGDRVFDPACELGCPFRSQNSELVEIEEDGDFKLRLTFVTGGPDGVPERHTESVMLTHRFDDPE